MLTFAIDAIITSVMHHIRPAVLSPLIPIDYTGPAVLPH